MPDIKIPVNLSNFAAIIENNPQDKNDDWNLSPYNKVKLHIKDHYSILQEDICFYCKINLRHGGYGEPIEHIVPRKDRPKWMFEPKNLALSCYTCNTKKKADNTLSISERNSKTYPINSSGFIIYHPHFDIWKSHFEVFNKYFIKPKSRKGRETFKVCELYRFNLPLDKAKQKGLNEEPFKTRILSKVLNDPNSSQKLIQQCNEISSEIIRRAKKRFEILNSN